MKSNKFVKLAAALFLTAISFVSSHSLAQSRRLNQGNSSSPVFNLLFKQNTLSLFASFSVGPVVSAESQMTLIIRDAATNLPMELSEDLEVQLWMPSMGHGSAPTQIERVLDSNGRVVPGMLKVRNIYFIMNGQWEVRFILRSQNRASETKVITLDL